MGAELGFWLPLLLNPGQEGENSLWPSLGASHVIAGIQQWSRFVSPSHIKVEACTTPLVRRQQHNWFIKTARKKRSKHCGTPQETPCH